MGGRWLGWGWEPGQGAEGQGWGWLRAATVHSLEGRYSGIFTSSLRWLRAELSASRGCSEGRKPAKRRPQGPREAGGVAWLWRWEEINGLSVYFKRVLVNEFTGPGDGLGEGVGGKKVYGTTPRFPGQAPGRSHGPMSWTKNGVAQKRGKG